jgi:hypothetical protein
MNVEDCSNCGRVIGISEQAYVYRGNVVCHYCYQKLHNNEDKQEQSAIKKPMEVSFEFKSYDNGFRTTIRGVTKQNYDGTERQSLIKKLKPGEELKLVREPNNPYDKYAIAVCRLSGEQLGYVPAGDRRLANHIDMGGSVSAKVVIVTGGPESYGCVIEIYKGPFGSEDTTPYVEKSREIQELIRTAQVLEANDPSKAISMYRGAIEQIVDFDKAGTLAAAWRQVRYPINRLSLLLVKSGDLKGAYEEILRYERFNDALGLTSTEEKSIAARKQRLFKKLNVKKD